MNQNATLGTNRTGVAAAPERSQEMLTGMEEFPPTSQGSALDTAQVRIAYAKAAESIGSVPMPEGWQNKVRTAVKAVQGEQPTLFMDKLGERLAFERTGTRLYEALISKFDAYGSTPNGPTREDLVEIHEDEQAHYELVREAMEELGGDPTAMTPSADMTGVKSMGL